jgi:hypothetical protein
MSQEETGLTDASRPLLKTRLSPFHLVQSSERCTLLAVVQREGR